MNPPTTGGGGAKTSDFVQGERASMTGLNTGSSGTEAEFHTGLLHRSGRNTQRTARFKKEYTCLLYIGVICLFLSSALNRF